MKRSLVRIVLSFALVLGALTLYAAPAAAQTIHATVWVTNTTTFTFTIPSSGVSANDEFTAEQRDPTAISTNSGFPPGIIGPGQTIWFESQSGSGFLNGTGGSLFIPTVGTLTWSAPWGYFFGDGESCNSSITPDSGFTVADIQGGWNSSSGANSYTCSFGFGLVATAPPLQSAAGALINGQALSKGTSFASLSDGGNLTLQLQDDGNLVLVDYGASPPNPLWATNTQNTSASVALMQGDGNLVLFDVNGNPLWWTGTQGNPNAYLTVDSSPGLDYGVIVHDSGGAPIDFVAP
jgi:hypothetical protein